MAPTEPDRQGQEPADLAPDEGTWRGKTRRIEQRVVVAMLGLAGAIVFAYGWVVPTLEPGQSQAAFLGLAGLLGFVAAAGVGLVRPAVVDVRRTLQRWEDAESTLVDHLKERAHRLDDYSRRLEQRNRDLRRFTYALAHDLREPARTVTTHARLVQRAVGDELPEEPAEDLEAAVRGAKRLDRLLADLLTYTDLERRSQGVQELDLEAAVHEAVTRLAAEIDDEDAQVEVRDLPTVEADPGQIVQLFRQLIHNAITFGPEDGPPRVVVDAEETEDGWTIAVEDNGIGMEPAYADRIFDLFERLHDWDSYEGTGVGLALCRQIVERHGGDIDVDTAPGEGTTILVTLPTVPDPRTEVQERAERGQRYRELV